MRWIFFHLFIFPTRLKLALLPARLMQKIGLYGLFRRIGIFKILPIQLRKMEQMLPATGKLWPAKLPENVPSSMGYQPVSSEHGQVARATKIAFFPGCIGSVMFDTVNRQAVELLAACGADITISRQQACCGAIHHHSGEWEPAKAFARRNIDAMLPAGGPVVDRITTTIAGCGAMLRDYAHLLRDDPQYADRAVEFSAKVRDISEVLAELELPEMKHPVNLTVTYHDACHLAHAQKVTGPPRKLLASISGLTLVPLAESDMCCGAAGTYNLTQPEMASDLAERKIKHIENSGAAICATGNVGCAMHIQSEAAAHKKNLRIVHPVELLHQAVFGNDGA
jgi:glycolate oxidase iron-sulfur subunit